MSFFRLKSCHFAAILALSLAWGASASVVYDESINGDLSNNGLAPTMITFANGSNQIFGTTGRGAAIDRDYFTFTIPTGYELLALTVLPGTTVGGATSFIGLQAGPQFTLSTAATTANGLLGWWHYAPGDGNILPEMAVPSNGSSGFSTIGAGSYSIWIQDFNTGTFTYGFDFAVTAAPEPSTFRVAALAFLGVIGLMYRRLRS